MRRFSGGQEVRTIVEMQWSPQLENGALLKAAELAAFDVLLTCDQNIGHQQNLRGRRLALVVLGSNIWPIARKYGQEISTLANAAKVGSHAFIEMPVHRKPRTRRT